MKSSMQGMTLIELMVVVLIVGILASIAVPSYRNYMLRTNRTEATTALLQLRTAQEKFFLQNNRYALTGELTTTNPGLGIPSSTPSGYYTITMVANNANFTFTGTATAAGGQAQDTACQTLTIDQLGQRGSAPGAITTCWK